MRQASVLISSVLATVILIGCGGGGGGGGGDAATATTVTSTATFIDSYVTGLEFESATQHGVTDTNGNFIYKEGESVTFHIGNLYIGSARPKDGKVTPLDIVNTSNISDTQVVRILRTLQTLDNDGDPTNGIVIDPVITETLKTQPRVDITTATDAEVLGMIGKNDYTVTANQAQSNFTPSVPTNQDKVYIPPVSTTTTPPVTSSTGNGKYTLVAWNDLGMHCVDGKDYSVFSILPPYNNLACSSDQ